LNYWDSSALVPLLVSEETSLKMRKHLVSDPEIATWWGSSIECISAIMRLVREGRFQENQVFLALRRLSQLKESWSEVQPGLLVRENAERLLRMHPLRAADSLQLAAAVVTSENRPNTLKFVCLDERLRNAAEKEGFILLP